MKSLAGPHFFRLFDLLLGATNPSLKFSRWTHDGVEFERERHSATGPKHGLAIEIFSLARVGRRGWSLMVIKEYWWAGEESKALKNLRWARATSGQRSDILTWLRAQEVALERTSSGARTRSMHGARAAGEEDATDEETLQERITIERG
jgi:hypothetical protein